MEQDFENYTSLSAYLKEIDRVPLLSREEEYDLAVKAKNGDMHAREKLISANCRFVVAVAKQYQNKGLSLEDLISEGNIGLIMGIDKFQPEKGFHFISYGIWWIRQAMLKAISEKSRLIRIPMNRTAQYSMVRKAQNLLESNGLEATLSAISEECGLSVEDVQEVLNYNKQICSLDAPLKDDAEASFGDFLESDTDKPEDETMNKALKEQFSKILSGFSERERQIIIMRYGLLDNKPLSLKQVGDIFGLTKERIRQLEKKTLQSLAENSEVQDMKYYIA